MNSDILINWTTQQKLHYNESYESYEAIKASLALFNQALCIIFGIVGIIGGILDIFVLAHSDFSKPSYIYHKALVINDLVYSMIGILSRALITLVCAPEDYRNFIIDMILIYSNFACLTAEAIVLFMSFERVIAIWVPLRFDQVNRYSVAITTCVLSVLFGTTYLFDFGMEKLVYDEESKVYTSVLTNFGQSDFLILFDYIVYCGELVVVYTMLFFSVLVVVGLFKRNSALTEKNDHKKTSLKHQLAVLTLSCAIPAAANCTAYVLRSTVLGGFKSGFKINLLYSEAISELNKVVANTVVYEFQLATGIMAHCLHFYLYILLSSNFRQKAILVLRKRSKISTIAVTQTHYNVRSTVLN